jgi:hypothetical protein
MLDVNVAGTRSGTTGINHQDGCLVILIQHCGARLCISQF